MVKSIRIAVGIAILGTASMATAQQVGDHCPRLAASNGLTWEFKGAGGTDFCRALRADGSEAFGLYIAKSSAFKPGRGDRAEEAQIDGRASYWYRSEIAGKPELQARETLVELPDGRVAYIWIQAHSAEELGKSISTANTLHFGPGGAQLTSK